MGARRYGISLRMFKRGILWVSVANEWDIEFNTRREIPYLQATMYYCVYYINTKPTILLRQFLFKRATAVKRKGRR